MDFFLLRLFPLTLMLGGLALGAAELRYYFHDSGQRGRLLRRLAGAALLLALSGMVMTGRIPNAHSMPADQVWVCFRHWLWVMAIALALMLLAAWDALAGVRQLRGFFEGVEREEIQKIQQHLAAAREES